MKFLGTFFGIKVCPQRLGRDDKQGSIDGANTVPLSMDALKYTFL